MLRVQAQHSSFLYNFLKASADILALSAEALTLAKEGSSELDAAMSNAYKLCDKAVSKGVLHKNTAARKKSRLTLAVKKLQAK